MAKAAVQQRDIEFGLTLSLNEALYLYDALRYVNPTDEHYDVIGGDSVFAALSDAMEGAGVDLNFDKGAYAQEF